MHLIRVKNVNEAFPLALQTLNSLGVARPSRDGDVLEYPGLFVTEYLNPEERVLFDPVRDCNPFFHFMEALWILAGRKDVGFISKFNSTISQFSDDGETFHGAYGDRMRVSVGGDQLIKVIHMLNKDKNTRRAVVQIWDADRDLSHPSKDIPCNDLLMFKVRGSRLDMTVCNRSNDLIWGAYGANVVHFSMVHEYVARMIGFHVGTYNQVSDSMHVYTERPQWLQVREHCIPATAIDPYRGDVTPYPMCQPSTSLDQLDADLYKFMENPVRDTSDYTDLFFADVAAPIYATWVIHKTSRDGLTAVKSIQAEDWRLACTQWLERRYDA